MAAKHWLFEDSTFERPFGDIHRTAAEAVRSALQLDANVDTLEGAVHEARAHKGGLCYRYDLASDEIKTRYPGLIPAQVFWLSVERTYSLIETRELAQAVCERLGKNGRVIAFPGATNTQQPLEKRAGS